MMLSFTILGNNMEHQQPSVAVITPSIGRASLRKSIESVRGQSYPCRHYVFVDGQNYHQAVQDIVKDYPDVIVTYLPMNTGANGMCNSVVNAVAPFLVTEDIICYLDDDNWIDEHHVRYLVDDLVKYQADYAYNLRYFVNQQGEIICEDNIYNLGFWRFDRIESVVHFDTFDMQFGLELHQGYLIDTNSYAIRRELAQNLAIVWVENGRVNDQNITAALLASDKVGICTGQRTVYYLIESRKLINISEDLRALYRQHHMGGDEDLEYVRVKILQALNQKVYAQHQQQNRPLLWLQKTRKKQNSIEVLVE